VKNDKVRHESRGGIAWVTLCDPPANTYSYEMMRELDTAILDARMDRAVHAIVVRGDGDKFFCAGADIKMLTEADSGFKYYFCLHANETLNRLEQTPKVVIAALNGHCVGGGLEIALAADLRVAKKGGGKIGLPEVKLGVLPGTGGTQRLARALGRARAFELMATGRTFAFEDARELGLVHAVFEAAEFDVKVEEYAAQFLPPSCASKAVGFIKRAVVSGLETSFSEGLALERELQQRLFESDDAKEGLAAYAQRRPPQFTGR
jgi:enoyl-CoA hydratase/carnithine racemase